MIKKLISTTFVVAGVLALLFACRQEELPGTKSAREGYVALHFNAEIPTMQVVNTRSVDPDGGGVQNMTLFCFDSYGLFISTASATVSSTDLTHGTFDAEVPENTRTIHFVANQNMTNFAEDNFRNRSEAQVMSLLEGSSGMMIYWARFACAEGDDSTIDRQLSAQGNAIRLIRNHAHISVVNPQGNSYLEVTGFAVYNTNAFGTVAPYHPTKGFEFTWPSEDDPFITLPENKAMLTEVEEVTTDTDTYVFECENSADNPVSVILRGHRLGETANDDLYYRVMLVDENGEQLLIRRNHHYQLNIQGSLSYGQSTFAEALTAAATNNVWISISDEVNEVEDADYRLAVAQTSYVIDGELADRSYTLSYTLEGKNDPLTDADRPEVSWLDDNHVAVTNITNTFDPATGQGTIHINLLQLGDNQKLEGTLLVKKGRLQRKIKVITVKEQSFTPCWVGTQVYGGISEENPTEGRAHVTLMFTIPESCPEELFPLRVLISTNELDVRSEAGIRLSVINAGEEGYGEPNEYGYKYVYTLEGKGVQRVYFENILNQDANATGTVKIEAEHFAPMTRTFSYSATHRSITVEGLNAYSVGSDPSLPTDEYVLYRLVPQKRYANVQFDFQLRDKTAGDGITGDLQGDPFNPTEKDEFLLYSQYLNYYLDSEADKAGVSEFLCTFYHTEAEAWGAANNPEGGTVRMFKPRSLTPAETGRYAIYMYTNRAKSAEVVRIASNLSGYPPVLAQDARDDGNYGGESYRSVTFELANYNPFRFSARVVKEGQEYGEDLSAEEQTAGAEEVVTPLEWSYSPQQQLDIEIDVTSFAGTDGKSADPFGEQFEIYIDAPMLEIDAARLAACGLNADKLKADPNVEGRFVYTVEASRDAERAFGRKAALKQDNIEGVNQAGERKTLPFVTNTAVSAGDIVISSNEEKVVYYAKTFRVTNVPITGTLQYTADGGTTLSNVPQNAFVSFERMSNGSRIGALTVTSDGHYSLRLRKEYAFNWYTDAVELHYEAADGTVYHRTYGSLSELFAAADIVLERAED